MLRTTLAGLRMHKSRLITTALAIVLGVMFVSGTLVFTGTLKEGFSSQVMGSADKFAAIVQPEDNGPAAPDADPELLPSSTLDEIRDLPEVAKADGVIKADAPLLDKEGRAVGAFPTVGLSVSDATRYSATEGRLPEAADEVALATNTASETGYEVGDKVTVLDPDGKKHTFTVTGLIDFGIDQELAFMGVVAFAPTTAAEMTGVSDFTEIDVVGADGTEDTAVASAVEKVAGSGAEVMTGQKKGEELAKSAGAQADVMATALMLFALISVFVAGIVIYNTFAILIAQRQREMALLRCVGAQRGQVFRSVLIEALIVGLVASALGVLAGIGIGYGAYVVGGEAFGAGGASTPLVVSPAAVIVGMLVGTLMTLFAALVPALRATRVPPLAALRTSAVAHGLDKGVGWKRIAGGSVFFLASAGLLAMALRGAQGQMGLVLTAVAGILAFIGVVITGPLLVRAVVSVVGIPMRKVGVPSMLAADNARRSPKRAATAMIALTVGATLITGYSVVSASVSKTMTDMMDKQFPVDYQISRQVGMDSGEVEGVPDDVADRLEKSSKIATVIAERSTFQENGGEPTRVTAYFNGEVGTDVTAETTSGDLADLGPGKVVLSEDMVSGGLGVGDTYTLETEKGERSFEIVAVTKESAQMFGAILDKEDFAADFPKIKDNQRVSVKGADDAESDEVRNAVYAAVDDDPTLQVTSLSQMKKQFDDMLDTAFLAIAAMLGLAIVIAVFGIANTMALSVLERTRESALLRALGLSRGQLRRMLSLEAVLLCLIGAGVGIGLGVLFGWAAGASSFRGMLFALPAGQIAVFIAVAVVAGLLASVLPGRKAAQTSITGALASE
ncbi:ABC transporter permease [Nocardiopsis rhodophaea]|uniref:ABC transporter permease n=1 Tax=Nocardiopsis rhodophaea TaxID=280238 RepID=A0ABN2TEB7_9ACTN